MHNGMYMETKGLKSSYLILWVSSTFPVMQYSIHCWGLLELTKVLIGKSFMTLYKRAFYMGYNKLQGINIETVYLPNGFNTLFGPVSAYQNEVAGVK